MVYLLKMVIFHGELLNNQMVSFLKGLVTAHHHGDWIQRSQRSQLRNKAELEVNLSAPGWFVRTARTMNQWIGLRENLYRKPWVLSSNKGGFV